MCFYHLHTVPTTILQQSVNPTNRNQNTCFTSAAIIKAGLSRHTSYIKLSSSNVLCLFCCL